MVVLFSKDEIKLVLDVQIFSCQSVNAVEVGGHGVSTS